MCCQIFRINSKRNTINQFNNVLNNKFRVIQNNIYLFENKSFYQLIKAQFIKVIFINE